MSGTPRIPMPRNIVPLLARFALAASFLTAVADRLGQYGPPGTPTVAWGDMQHFQSYARQLNPWFPASVIPALSWSVTVAETLLGLSLIAGFQIRRVSVLSGGLLFAFAVGMTAGIGIRSALYASVFSASACALLLSQREADPYTLDHLIRRSHVAGGSPSRAWIHPAAAGWAVLFAAPHVWWALGVPAGFPGGAEGHKLLMTTWRFYFDAAVVGLSALAVLVALAPLFRWSESLPVGAWRAMSWAACVLLSLRGVAGLFADGVTDLVWWPAFLLGGLLFGGVALTPDRRPDRQHR